MPPLPSQNKPPTGLAIRYFVVCQGAWFVAVYGGAHANVVPGLVCAAGIASWHLLRAPRRWSEARVIAVVTLAGWTWDSLLAGTGWLVYPGRPAMFVHAPLCALLLLGPHGIVNAQESKMLVRISEIEIFNQHVEEYRHILNEEAEASVRLEPGVLCIFPMTHEDSPTQIRRTQCPSSSGSRARGRNERWPDWKNGLSLKGARTSVVGTQAACQMSCCR